MINTLHYRPLQQSKDTELNTLYIEHASKPIQTYPYKKPVSSWVKSLFQKHEKNSLYLKHIRKQLRSVGIRGIDLIKPEVTTLASILRPDETILAAISGKVKEEGSALIVVTSDRVLYLNDIPLFTNLDEEGFENIRGISSNLGKWDATITLHTDIGDFKMNSVGIEAAHNFIYVVERYCIRPQAHIGQSR